jgi:hypothetical protein
MLQPLLGAQLGAQLDPQSDAQSDPQENPELDNGANPDIFTSRWLLSQAGHFRVSVSLVFITSFSNSAPQSRHSYSKSGINFLQMHS